MKETNIDCMKYRKSTHLAGVDVEMIIAEKGNCVLTIKDSYYATGIDVSGNKTDGYFIEFLEDAKPMLVNSINRKTIASIVKINKAITSAESRIISSWIGQSIELYFDDKVKMMGQVVGGIRIKPISPIANIDDSNALTILNESKTLSQLKTNWERLKTQEKTLPSVVKLKEYLKQNLK
jgi:hypothetical protein